MLSADLLLQPLACMQTASPESTSLQIVHHMQMLLTCGSMQAQIFLHAASILAATAHSFDD